MSAVPTNFWQWLSSVNQRDQMPIVVTLFCVTAAALVIVAVIVAFTVYKVHRNRLNDSLKRELLERGLSADDIVEVVRATPLRRGER
jgi:hypothetical protein